MKANAAYELARADLGTWKWAGDDHNPKVLQYFKDVGHACVKDDETAWCAAFVGAMLKKAGLPHTGKLNARSYMHYGEAVGLNDAQPGDIAVFSRGDPKGWQGHVAFFVRPTAAGILVLGGNQSNQVTEAIYPRTRLLGIRRPPQAEKPAPVKETPAPAQKVSRFAAFFNALFGGWKK